MSLLHQPSKTVAKRIGAALLLMSGLLLALAILFTVGQSLLSFVSGDQLNQLNDGITSFGFWMQFLRWTLYLLLFVYWREVIAFWSRVQHWNEAVTERAQASRRSTLLILIAVELLLIQTIQVSIYTFLTR